MKVELEHRPLPAELDGFVGSFPAATFFQSPSWLEAIRDSFPRFDVAWLAAREGSELLGMMPFVRIPKGPFSSLWALPFGSYGDPLARDERVRSALCDRFFEMASSHAVLEAALVLFQGRLPSRMRRGARVYEEECRLVRLEGDIETVCRSWSSKRRQLVRRGEEAGVVARLLEDEKEVGRFYEIYANQSRAWGGVHPYPEAFFLELFRRRSRGALFWGAYLNGELLGCHIDFYFGDMAQAWQGGMTERAHELEVGAILIKSAMEEAFRRGCRVFNLGSSGGDPGILFFKESLGGVEYRYPVVAVRKPLWAIVRGALRT